ncbi:MAG: AAA family ATPase [Candidatus Thorarchaeota archaeon]|nr:AAA family ATPase [Candidatus Thorarchaeota archaeon]
MSRDDLLTEVVILIDPEDLADERFSQPAVIERAKLFRSVLSTHVNFRDVLEKKGLSFGGRVLLIGPPGTDFEAFPHHIAQEVPMKTVKLRISSAIGDSRRISESVRTALEFAKRNAPAVLYLEKIDVLGKSATNHAAVLYSSLKEYTWDENEVLVICTTSDPDMVERDLLALFDRVYIFPTPQVEERVKVFETLFEGRKDIDPTLVAESTEGWGFSDIHHLAVSFLTDVPENTELLPRIKIEQIIENSGVMGMARYEIHDSVSRIARGEHSPSVESLQSEYPDDFLDQLYLMAVGDDFQGTQRIIEALNANHPLTPQDREFLARYPFILTGKAEDRLTRLMRAKRSSDRLSRIMGR